VYRNTLTSVDRSTLLLTVLPFQARRTRRTQRTQRTCEGPCQFAPAGLKASANSRKDQVAPFVLTQRSVVSQQAGIAARGPQARGDDSGFPGTRVPYGSSCTLVRGNALSSNGWLRQPRGVASGGCDLSRGPWCSSCP
jgi:hypothetical protein